MEPEDPLRGTASAAAAVESRVLALAPGIAYSFRLSPDGHASIPYASARLEDIYGWRPEQLEADAEPILAMTHPDDDARLRATIAESARTLRPWRCEFRVRNPARGEIWVEGHSLPEREADGSTLWHGLITDISERRRAEQAQREIEARHRALFDNMREGLAYCQILHGADGRPTDFRYLEVNPAFERLTGLRGVAGRLVSEVIPGFAAGNPELLEGFGRVAASGSSEIFESYVPGLDLWFHVSAYCPRPGHFAAVFDTISERKRAEASLAESEARYRTLVESAPEAILVFDVHAGRCVDLNRNAELLFAMTRDELLRVEPLDLCAPRQADGVLAAEMAGPLVRRTLAGERPVVDWRCRSARGEEIACEIWLARIPAARPLLRCSVVDVRQRQALEERLRQAHKMEAIGRLAGGVAHDFNNLLGVITGYSELAQRQLDAGHPASSRIAEIRKAAGRAASLTRQLLAFSRRQVLQPRPVDINALLADLVDMLHRLIGEDIELVLRPGRALPPVLVDPGQIEQVVVNLAVNARDAMPRGGTLTLWTEAAPPTADAAEVAGQDGRRRVLLGVADTGLGMDESTLGHLFEPFFTTKPAGQGTGLGLATVYGIVEQSGGTISVQSHPGQGSSFRIILPSAPGAPAPEVEIASEPVGGHETILLVEDLEPLRQMLGESLEELGYRILLASGGPEALALAREHQGAIDLLVVDVVMPGMDGRDLARQLLHTRPGLPVLYMSGYTSDVLGRHGVLDPDLQLIEKPFTTDVLARRVRDMLARC